MAVIMLSFMLKMYTNRRVNIAIFVGSAVVFCVAPWLVRSQATIEDVSYMKAMIPHHSIAILTSERAHIAEACRPNPREPAQRNPRDEGANQRSPRQEVVLNFSFDQQLAVRKMGRHWRQRELET